jgi:cation:H+ antiporter
VSPLLVGLTLVGFGTSTPELVTSLTAALNGSPGIAVGNVVGSNIANILLILGITVMIMRLPVAPEAYRRDGLALVGSTLACLAAVLWGSLDRGVGVVLLALLAGYLVWAYRSERATPDAEEERHEHMAEDVPPAGRTVLASAGIALLGIVITIVGARMLVSGAVDLATGFGVSDTLIGLTIVAVGTSLPELVACGVAALRGHSDVALGNVIGSNIYNVLGILGITALVKPIPVPPEIARLDIWVLIGATALLMVFLRTGWRLRRWEGFAFLLLYVAYLGWLAASA